MIRHHGVRHDHSYRKFSIALTPELSNILLDQFINLITSFQPDLKPA